MAQCEDNFFLSSHQRSSKCRRTLILMKELNRALPSYMEIESEEVLNTLEAIETDVMLGKPLRWYLLIHVIRGMRVNDETAPDCLNLAKELLGLFERYQCRDIRLISDVFVILLHLTQPYFTFHKPIEFEKSFYTLYGEEKTDVDLVWNSMRYANLGLLKLQLKFGMGMMLASSSVCWVLIEQILHDWPRDSHDDKTDNESTPDDELSIQNPVRRAIRMRSRTKETVINKLRWNFNRKSMKRLDLVLRVLDMLLKMKLCRRDYTEQFIECYGLLFDSIPEAFVTSVEVEASLEKCVPARFSRIIPRITRDFQNLLPQLADVPKPRSLKHLCRIRVRQSLRQNLNLPSGVSSLPLPMLLKDYVLLNDDGDYSSIIKSYFGYDSSRIQYCSMPDSYIPFPERDDCITSFFKTL